MKPNERSDVLVVGGGPVGLFAALSLAGRDVKTQILDKDWSGAEHSYALALHPLSLQLLDEIGLASELIEQGRRVDTIGIYDTRRRLGELRLDRLDGRFPFVLVLPQNVLEQALERRLRQVDVRLLWNHQLLALAPGAGHVDCEIGRIEKIPVGYPIARSESVVQKRFRTQAGFVIGADGYHSFTRKAIGARYADLGGTRMFAVFEFETNDDPGDEVRLGFHRDTVNVLWPMKGNRARFSFEVRSTEGPLDDGSLLTLLRERAPWFEAQPGPIRWRAYTHFERRLAEPFGGGRIWLAGDSAHITGPAGVQSMNVGLREARDLAGRVASILAGSEPLAELETYERERRTEWESLLQIGTRIEAGPGAPEWAREHAERLLPCLPASGDQLEAILAQAGLGLK